MRLRLVRRELEDALEDRHRELRLAGLLQPIGEQAQHLAVLQVHLGEVREHAQAHRLSTLGEEELGGVEEEADVVLVGAALVEVDGLPVLGPRRLQAPDRAAGVRRRA